MTAEPTDARLAYAGDPVAPVRAQGPPGGWTGLVRLPVTFVLALYMLLGSRWGSYLGVPGLPFFAGDILLGVATVQLVVAAHRGTAAVGRLARAPLALLLTASLTAYAVVRFLVGVTVSTEALRDFAPYAYGVTALYAFFLPVRGEHRMRRFVYAVLSLHTLWVLALPKVPGFPWNLPVLGSDAVLLVARPDFDAAVLGITAAFALHDLVLGKTERSTRVRLLLVAFAAVNAYGAATLSSRAGFLASLAAGAAVLLAWLLRPRARQDGLPDRRRRRDVLALLLGVAAVALVVMVTPTGTRLVQGLETGSSQASGTIHVRQDVWRRVGSYVFHDPLRTAVGVGFGRNFIAESGTRDALEGTTYTNVRSPHNYVVGTLARLGVAGALLAGLVILCGWYLALARLRFGCGPVTALAALVAIAVPVTALLGVVLESPFGALPYFWAIGQLSVAGTMVTSRLSPRPIPPADRAEPCERRGPRR